MRARVPASSANLGPGFDVLAVALSCYVEVSIEPSDSLEVFTYGEGSQLPADGTHLAARVAEGVLGHDRFRVEVQSDIPVGRGLGSSAALAVAAAAAAGSPDPFGVGVSVDGHAENAAASAFGGLVVATVVGDKPVWRRLPLDPGLRFVAVVPEMELLTSHARSMLSSTVDLRDAVFNLGRMGLLIAGLGDHSLLIPEAGDDRLHQEVRSRFVPRCPAYPRRPPRGGRPHLVLVRSGNDPSRRLSRGSGCGGGECGDTYSRIGRCAGHRPWYGARSVGYHPVCRAG